MGDEAMTEPRIEWRTSSYSNNGTCVEVADLPDGGRLVRDTKLGVASPVLRYTAAEWRAFIAGVKAGEFDDLT
jgi:predicted secreted Zn-dependent protease